MIGVVVHLEDRWNYTQSDRDIDVMQMYQESIRALGADLLIIVDKTTEGMFHKLALDQVAYKSLADVLADYPDATKLYFEHINAIPAGTEYISLDELVHPKENVLYIFGGDVNGLNFAEIQLKENDKIVSIVFTKYILWSITSATIVMYDRYMKGK